MTPSLPITVHLLSNLLPCTFLSFNEFLLFPLPFSVWPRLFETPIPLAYLVHTQCRMGPLPVPTTLDHESSNLRWVEDSGPQYMLVFFSLPPPPSRERRRTLRGAYPSSTPSSYLYEPHFVQRLPSTVFSYMEPRVLSIALSIVTVVMSFFPSHAPVHYLYVAQAKACPSSLFFVFGLYVKAIVIYPPS